MTNIITPTFRVAFPQVFEPKQFKGQGLPYYSISMIFDKDADLKALKAAIAACAKEAFPKRDPKTLKLPIKDGNTILNKETGKQYDMYKDKIVITAVSKKRRPEIINAKKELVISEADFYAGCYARASVLPYSYDFNGQGISLGLQNLQKIKDGESFLNIVAAEDEFEALDLIVEEEKVEESEFDALI